jgi:Stage II sporulation protein
MSDWGRFLLDIRSIGTARAATRGLTCVTAVGLCLMGAGDARASLSQLETINVIGIGQIPTETDYVPNVVFSENGAASFEALKAQAVAARTFAYYKMLTSGSIQNGTGDQVYHVPGRGYAQQVHFAATNATEGEILTIKNFSGIDTLIAAFYVAGAIPSGPSPVAKPTDPDPTNTEQWVTYTYEQGLIGGFNTGTPLGFQGTPTNPNWPNRGAKSQNGANFMGQQGVSYVDILKYYYGSDIQLETVSPTLGQPALQYVKTLTDFELNSGYFGNDPYFSGLNQNLGAGTLTQRSTAAARSGTWGQQVTIDLDESAGGGFLFQHVAGTEFATGLFTGKRQANLAVESLGSIGFWLKTQSPGLTVSVKLDDEDNGTEQALFQNVIADGQWNLYEWSLQNAALWSASAAEGGDGVLGDTISLDSIVFAGGQDSLVFLDDIFYTPPASGPIFGDLNGDGFVGLDDLNIVLSNWNQTVPKGDLSQGDAGGNGDGFVGLDDLNVVLANWNLGSFPPAELLAQVPEPGTLATAGLIAAAGLSRRRGRRRAIQATG